jgi:hypothetical protein
VSAVVSFVAEILFVVFLLGILGSFVVIAVTFVEDLGLFIPDKESTDDLG